MESTSWRRAFDFPEWPLVWGVFYRQNLFPMGGAIITEKGRLSAQPIKILLLNTVV